MSSISPRSKSTNPPSVLIVHNKYRQPGGEDAVFELEARLLESHGHAVTRLVFDNTDIPDQRSPLVSARLAASTIWSPRAVAQVRHTVRAAQVDLVHFHNTFPLISPAAYTACKTLGVAVVQTLHNYRLLCPNAIFFRAGHICEECLDYKSPWAGVLHACYAGSHAQTAVIAAMLSTHRLRHTWHRDVDLYIALTEFSRQKFIAGALPEHKVVVKPNFVYPDRGLGEHRGSYALFVGRLSEEKGVQTLLRGWDRLEGKLALKIVGDGPLADQVQKATQRGIGVEWLGRQPREQVLALMKDALVLLVPSLWYECFPMVIAEAYATGLPVIASNLGSMASLIEHGRTGLLFTPGDPFDLLAKVTWACKHPHELAEMGHEARREYEAKYTAECNYRMLMEIYQLAIHCAPRGC